jgi:hypothetical protein
MSRAWWQDAVLFDIAITQACTESQRRTSHAQNYLFFRDFVIAVICGARTIFL